MNDIFVEQIRFEGTFSLRQSILRPHQNISEMKYPNDELKEAGHFGAFQNRSLVGIVSVYPETRSGEFDLESWRLRGMAVEDGLQGKGVGRKLVDVAMKHCRTLGGKEVWCNARTSAIPFYEKIGFQKEGAEFEIDGIGPHFIASIKV